MQFLSVKHSTALPKTADDIEGTLYKFIPSGLVTQKKNNFFLPFLSHHLPLFPYLDYLKSESEFINRVERDATAFRPLGTKIASYTRRAPSTGKGKGKTRVDVPVDEEADDAVVYEVYHVSSFPQPCEMWCNVMVPHRCTRDTGRCWLMRFIRDIV